MAAPDNTLVAPPSVHWTILEVVKLNSRNMLLCRCVCGKEKILRRDDVYGAKSRSCGCQMGRSGAAGRSGTPSYYTWKTMVSRCYSESNGSYKYYGAKGITVCDRWRGDGGFNNFLADMGERPDDMTLDRIDSSKHYSPDNCRWATRSTQQNNREFCPKYEYNGERLTATEWARKTGINVGTLTTRLQNWSVEKALTTPVKSKFSRTKHKT